MNNTEALTATQIESIPPSAAFLILGFMIGGIIANNLSGDNWGEAFFFGPILGFISLAFFSFIIYLVACMFGVV